MFKVQSITCVYKKIIIVEAEYTSTKLLMYINKIMVLNQMQVVKLITY